MQRDQKQLEVQCSRDQKRNGGLGLLHTGRNPRHTSGCPLEDPTKGEATRTARAPSGTAKSFKLDMRGRAQQKSDMIIESANLWRRGSQTKFNRVTVKATEHISRYGVDRMERVEACHPPAVNLVCKRLQTG